MEKPQYYIVEFMEDYLSEWTLNEFIQMHKYLKRIPKNVLLITNFQEILSNKEKENCENLILLKEYLKSESGNNFLMAKYKLQDYLGEDALEITGFVGLGNPETHLVVKIPKNKICLLDMRGQSVLQPADSSNFDAFVFGGILGDHPPRDRTSLLRCNFVEQRRLTKLQMSTDTAVLVTDIILNDSLTLDQIPFLSEPEFCDPSDKECTVQMEGFVYVSNKYDLHSRTFVNRDFEEPIMSATIKNKLLFMDLDFHLTDFGI